MTEKKQSQKKPKSKKTFKVGITIPKFGRVEKGQEATAEAIQALEASNVDIELYLK